MKRVLTVLLLTAGPLHAAERQVHRDLAWAAT